MILPRWNSTSCLMGKLPQVCVLAGSASSMILPRRSQKAGFAGHPRPIQASPKIHFSTSDDFVEFRVLFIIAVRFPSCVTMHVHKPAKRGH